MLEAELTIGCIDDFFKPALCRIAQAQAEAIDIADTLQEMDLIIAGLGEVIVKVFVYLIERIASIAIDTKLDTLLDIQRRFFLAGML